DEDSSIEKLTFEPHIAKLLLPYRRVLEEMRNHHIEEELQRAQNLSLMLKWSVVDYSLFKGPKFCPNLSRPAVNMNLLKSVLMETQNRNLRHAVIIVYNLITKEIVDNVNSNIRQWLARLFGVHKNEHCIIDSENHIKSQMWAKIFSDTFLISSEEIGVNWKYHHKIPGNGGCGSSRSDFAAVIFNGANQQFPFFITEFENDGFAVHKDAVAVVAETAFEYNRMLAVAYYLSEDEMNANCLHIGLVNGTTIYLSSMKVVYDETKSALIYTYENNGVTFKLHTEDQQADIVSVLKLVTYLRTNVYHNGVTLNILLNRTTDTRNGALLASLPRLPRKAVKSRLSEIEFTPSAKRVKYIDIGLNIEIQNV
ncbi:9552_t:CDS:2, partial [Funneliformis caledonium]